MPIAALLTFLPQFIKAGEDLYGFIAQLRTAAKQSGEWDETHEQAYAAYLTSLGRSPEWQPQDVPKA